MTDKSSQHLDARSVQAYARTAGLLLLVSMVAGGFGEAYVPSVLMATDDAAETAKRITQAGSLYMLGYGGYLIEALCDTALVVILYVLLKPVNRTISLIAAALGLVGTAQFAATEIFYLAPKLILGGADYLKGFSQEQLNALALLSLKIYGRGGALFMVFYGLPWMLRGYLMVRSGYLPKLLGVLMILGGLGFVTRNVLLVLAPQYATGYLLAAMLPGGLLLALWLLIRGVNVRKWEEKTASA